jgi:hypothetical protein
LPGSWLFLSGLSTWIMAALIDPIHSGAAPRPPGQCVARMGPYTGRERDPEVKKSAWLRPRAARGVGGSLRSCGSQLGVEVQCPIFLCSCSSSKRARQRQRSSTCTSTIREELLLHSAMARVADSRSDQRNLHRSRGVWASATHRGVLQAASQVSCFQVIIYRHAGTCGAALV